MENEKIAAPIVFEQLKTYAETKIKLEKLKAIRTGSPIFASVIIYIIAGCSLILGFLYGSVALAFFLGSLLGSLLAGFACLAGLFVAFGLLVLFAKKPLEMPIINTIVRKTAN